MAARSPVSKTFETLSGHSSHTGGLPGRAASAVAVTEGSGLVLDPDQLGGVLRLGHRLRDQERDRIAHASHPVPHEDGMDGREHG